MSYRTGMRVASLAATAALLITLAGASSAVAIERNSGCLSCHSTSYDFSSAPVDRDVVCRACHTPGLLGDHPYHQTGANCGAVCHPGWGDTLLSAVPQYLTSAGSFASQSSKDT